MRGSTKVLLVAALLGAAGCNSYSYFDFNVTIAPSLGSQAAQTISSCQMYVTGAVTGDFPIPPNHDDGTAWCPPAAPSLFITRVNYSTFANSGAVTFTFKGYKGAGQGCEIAEGSTTMNVKEGMTQTGPDLVVSAHDPGAACM